MSKKKKNRPDPELNLAESSWEEEYRETKNELDRERIILTRKVAINPLAKGYYIQMKSLLEDLLMMELAQKAVEATMKAETRNKIIVIDDAALNLFRAEMMKAKALKLVEGTLALSGRCDIDNIMDKLTTTMYGPRMEKPAKEEGKVIAQLRGLLDDYASKIEKVIKAEAAKIGV